MIPAEDSLTVAQRIKEQYSYVCPDIVKEFKKYDQEGDKYFKKYEGVHSVTGKVLFHFLELHRWEGQMDMYSKEEC
jgi:hypothetical protein